MLSVDRGRRDAALATEPALRFVPDGLDGAQQLDPFASFMPPWSSNARACGPCGGSIATR